MTQCQHFTIVTSLLFFANASEYCCCRTGIFTLSSDRGLPEIGQCRERGFHQHTKAPPLFDVSWNPRGLSHVPNSFFIDKMQALLVSVKR